MENKTIITISRQFGSGGREIKIAEQLNIPFYDKELIEITAKESGMDEELFVEDDERTSRGFHLLGAIGYSYREQYRYDGINFQMIVYLLFSLR